MPKRRCVELSLAEKVIQTAANGSETELGEALARWHRSINMVSIRDSKREGMGVFDFRLLSVVATEPNVYHCMVRCVREHTVELANITGSRELAVELAARGRRPLPASYEPGARPGITAPSTHP